MLNETMAESLNLASVKAPDAATTSRRIRRISGAVILCFLLSGATGLIYEVLWTRMLGLVFGHTVFAITTVLAAFMAGLGLGSYLVGSMADRHGNPLRLYGLLEVGIGTYALLTPVLFSKAEAIYLPLYQALGLSFLALSLSQFLLTFLILLVPTTLMGATLPILSRFFVREIETLGTKVGQLYALNTFGAVLGTYAAGFHLIPILGLRMTLLFGGLANIGIGMLAIVLDRLLYQYVHHASVPSPAHQAPVSEKLALALWNRSWELRVGGWLTVAGLGVSGAVAMIYEVAWTRALSLVIGSSTYAFSTMLVAFLGGLAMGSYSFSRLAGRLRVDPFLFAVLQLGIGLSALAVSPFFDRMPEVFLRAFRVSQSPGFVKLVEFTISALTMFLPTIFMGATFPCVVQIASKEIHRLGYDVGRIYFINTGGAIAGAVSAGFLLIPTLGLQSTLKLAVSTNLCLALVLFVVVRNGRWRRRLAALVPLIALAVLYVSPPWDAKALSSGVAIYGRRYFDLVDKGDFRKAIAPMSRLLYYRDGISSTVTVHGGRGDEIFLRINGKTDASNTNDMHTQLMLGHLPLLLHPNPKDVLVIGLGSGVTAGAVALYSVKAIDLVEIEPAVVEAAGFFAKENRKVLRDPRVHVVVADGRNFLMASKKRYDVIITEPSNPWLRGIGNLFSLEFYHLAAERLAPRGIVCQWIQSYGLFPEDLKMVVNTFRLVFPHTSIWGASHGDLLLIGSKEPVGLDYALLQSRFDSIPALQEDLARLRFRSPLVLLADFVLGEEDTARFSQDARINTDDLPLLEFSAPQSLYVDTIELNSRLIKSFKQQAIPPILGLPEQSLESAGFRRDMALAFLGKGMRYEALAQFDEVLRLNPRDTNSLFERGKLLLQLGILPRAESDFKAVLRIDPERADAHDFLVQLYTTQQRWDLVNEHLSRRSP